MSFFLLYFAVLKRVIVVDGKQRSGGKDDVLLTLLTCQRLYFCIGKQSAPAPQIMLLW